MPSNSVKPAGGAVQAALTALIAKKRDGKELTIKEINFFIRSIVENEVEGSQIGAMLMAMYLQGMNEAETAALTQAMACSGSTFKWPQKWRHLVVDKHSTGGVGDKVSLILVPALASCGLKVPMISGRALGLTGGTLDKLEAIPGYRVLLPREEIELCMEKIGCCIAGQTNEMVPADKVLYRLRDLTSTVSSEPLITGSIMSKKLSEDLAALVLDVKFGKGTVMQATKEESANFAKKMMSACKNTETKVAAFITSMDIPLGNKIGCTLEIEETVETLVGRGLADMVDIVSQMGGKLLHLTQQVPTFEEGVRRIQTSLRDGSALAKFKELLSAHGVSNEVIDSLCRGLKEAMPVAPYKTNIIYKGESGFVVDINAEILGKMWRQEYDEACTSHDQRVKYSVGFELLIQYGDKIINGEPWAIFHHHKPSLTEEQLHAFERCVYTSPSEPDPKIYPRIAEIID